MVRINPFSPLGPGEGKEDHFVDMLLYCAQSADLGRYTDLQIFGGGQPGDGSVPVHKPFLTVYSPYLRQLLSQFPTSDAIILADFSKKTAEDFLDLIYYGSLTKEAYNMLELEELLCLLQLPTLQDYSRNNNVTEESTTSLSGQIKPNNNFCKSAKNLDLKEAYVELEKIDPNKSHLCQFCSKKFLRRESLHDHLKNATKCKTAALGELDKVVDTNDKTCSLCKMGFQNERDFEAHVELCQLKKQRNKRRMEDEVFESKAQCPVCQKKFKSLYMTAKHVACDHFSKELTNRFTSNNGKHCIECGYDLQRHDYMMFHVAKMHDGLKDLLRQDQYNQIKQALDSSTHKPRKMLKPALDSYEYESRTTDEFVCKKCQLVLDNKNALRDHSKSCQIDAVAVGLADDFSTEADESE